MEGAIIRVLCLTVFLSLIIPKGLSQVITPCETEKIHINQKQTGNVVQSKPEWEVSVTHNCTCDITNLQLYCPNIETVSTDQTLLSEVGKSGICLFYGGKQIIRTDVYVINYVGDGIRLSPYSYTTTTPCSDPPKPY